MPRRDRISKNPDRVAAGLPPRGRPPVVHPPLVGGPFSGLMQGGYPCVLADPPWDHKQFSARGMSRHPSRHYPTMKLSDIKALPVGDLAAKDGWLFMWTTHPHLEQAFEVMRAWGYKYSSVFQTWIKLNPKAASVMFFQHADFHIGTGYTSRKNSELLLLGRRGRAEILTKPFELLLARRREHSRKPDLQYPRIEGYCPGPRLELFSRQDREGWTSWGLEAGKFDAPRVPLKLSAPTDDGAGGEFCGGLITEEDLRILDYPEDQIMQFRRIRR